MENIFYDSNACAWNGSEFAFGMALSDEFLNNFTRNLRSEVSYQFVIGVRENKLVRDGITRTVIASSTTKRQTLVDSKNLPTWDSRPFVCSSKDSYISEGDSSQYDKISVKVKDGTNGVDDAETAFTVISNVPDHDKWSKKLFLRFKV